MPEQQSAPPVSARAAPGLLFFIAFCVLTPVPQQAALSQQEEGSPAWASPLGLKGSDDKNARNECFSRGGSHLVSIKQRSRRCLVFLPPSSTSLLQTLHDIFFPCTLRGSERRLCVRWCCLHARTAPHSGLGWCYGPCLPSPPCSLCYSQGRPVSHACPGRCLHQHRGSTSTDQKHEPFRAKYSAQPLASPVWVLPNEKLLFFAW